MTVRLYLGSPFSDFFLRLGRLLRLERRKVAMLRAFTVGFQKVLRVVF